MRLVRVQAPGADARVVRSVGEAIRAFSASLDIRLRFLSIGIEETVVDVTDAASAAERVGAAVSPDAPGGPADLVLLLGRGEAAVAAAVAAARAAVPVVRVGAGARSGLDGGLDGGRDDASARAVDRICPVLLAHDEAAAAALRAEHVPGAIEIVGGAEAPETGERIVRAVSRARRRERC